MKVEYLNNKEFEELIKKYNHVKNTLGETSVEYRLLRDDLAINFYKITQNIMRKFRFENVDKDDALQEGVLICFEKLHRFDSDKGKAFNFFSTISINHFRQLYRTAKSYNDLKSKYFDHLCDKNYDQINISNKKKKNSYKKSDDDDVA